jgi:hypothetical protein
MKTEEIVRLTRRTVADLVRARHGDVEPFLGHERRRSPRWPFPGTVELHPTDGTTDQWFATCRNVSETGLGMCCDRFFDVGTVLEIAIHVPERTLYGRGIVGYCQKTPAGFMTGIEFDFDAD